MHRKLAAAECSFIQGRSGAQGRLRGRGIGSRNAAFSGSSGHNIARTFNATGETHGADIGTSGSSIRGSLPKVDEIQVKNASIAASSQQRGTDIVDNTKRPVSKITIDGGHVTLSSASVTGIGSASTMVNLHLDISSSTVDAIRIKGLVPRSR